MTDTVRIVERMPYVRSSKWKGERLEFLKQLIAEGLAPAAIAGRMAERYVGETFTRNMIIGAVHRNSLDCAARKSGRPRFSVPQIAKPPNGQGKTTALVHKRKQGNHEAKTVELFEPETDPVDNAIPLDQRCTLLELNDDRCRWPVGIPGKGLFFCGGKTHNKSNYCSRHTRVSTAGPQVWNGRRS